MGYVVRFMALAVLAITLAACENNPQPYATDAQVNAVRYVSDAPPSITLITMINNTTGAGGHSALMVNGSERVIFDPAGNFHVAQVPERDDVLYGISPRMLQAYKSSHARASHHVLLQTVEVSPEVAEYALRAVEQNGKVPAALCSNATSSLLKTVPGFESLRTVWDPAKLAQQFAQLPNVKTERYYEDDAGDFHDSLEALQADLAQSQ